MNNFVIGVLVLLLSACATTEEYMLEEAQANATYTRNLPPLVVEVEDVYLACESAGILIHRTPDRILYGCADIWGRYENGYCTIFIWKWAPVTTIFHEKLHCIYGLWHSLIKGILMKLEIGQVVYYRLPDKIFWNRGRIAKFPAEGLVEIEREKDDHPIVVSSTEVMIKPEVM